MTYRRPLFTPLLARVREKRRFLQVLAGPRQSGKTTLARQIADAAPFPVRFISADDPGMHGRTWLQQQWDLARIDARDAGKEGSLLIIDEIQRLPRWSESVKRLWDEDGRTRVPLKVLILGSAPLLIHQGIAESLAGRFEVLRSTHWSYREMKDAFGWSLDQYIFFGGYPGAASLIGDQDRWKHHLLDAMIEPTLARDILQLQRVDKPALLRHLFTLGCAYSGQSLSYTKLLGQLQDAGNTTTLAHYLDLLHTAGMLTGLPKFAGQKVRQRGSSPKFQALNNALVTCQSGLTFEQARNDHSTWGRLVESAVGAHLVNGAASGSFGVSYWREGDREVDFVLHQGRTVIALEVKSGTGPAPTPGLDAFLRSFKPRKTLLIGSGGIPLDRFLSEAPDQWLA